MKLTIPSVLIPEVEALSEQLINIPFMSLHREFDLDWLKKEASQVDRYVPYMTVFGNEELKAKYARAWAGRSLLAYEEDSTSGMTELVGEAAERALTLPLVSTDLALSCPYIMSVVEDLRGHFRHARLMRIAPKSSLSWHSHVNNQGQRPTTVTVHVPILMPEEFRYSVTKGSNLQGGKVVDQSKVFNAKFTAGRATYFNSYHYHNVFNDSDEERISLMLYVGLYDEVAFDMFLAALGKYTGPRV